MPVADPRLEALLTPAPDPAERWLSLAGAACPPLVLFGAGQLGRMLARGLRGRGFEIRGFADNAQGLWNTTVEGLPVQSPEDSVRLAPPGTCFVIAIWRASGGHRAQDTERQLRALGARHVAHAGHLMRLLPERFLPHFALDRPPGLEHGEAIQEAYALLADEDSRTVFRGHLAWCRDLDFDALGAPWDEEPYFPPSLFCPREGDGLVDAGAYDGDTLRRALTLWGPRLGRYHAFEPDPLNRAALEATALASGHGDRIVVHGCALGDAPGWCRFRSGEGLASSVSVDGDQDVWCDTLDRTVGEDRIAHLKMDIEGAEPEALRGAAGLIVRDRPFLALSAYHRQSHLWELPLLVHALEPGYQLRYRDHGTEGWDLVLYASPSGPSIP